MDVKRIEVLRQYFALALILLLCVGIVFWLRDYLTAIVGAVFFAFFMYPIYLFFLRVFGGRESLSAIVVIVLIFLVVLVPIFLMARVFFSYLMGFDFSTLDFVALESFIFDVSGIEFSVSDGLFSLWSRFVVGAKSVFPRVLSFTSSFFLKSFILFFVMFYLLVEKDKFLRWVYLLLPFSRETTDYLIDESGKISKAILIGQVLTAVVQGLLGMVSFFIAGIEGALLWGFLMIVLSIIPVVGAFLVWVPAGLFLILDGSVGMGIFVLLWGAFVVSQIDNIIRPKLVNRFANIHPLETLIGVFMGISAFGFVGIVLGPLLISLFTLFIDAYVKDYGQK